MAQVKNVHFLDERCQLFTISNNKNITRKANFKQIDPFTLHTLFSPETIAKRLMYFHSYNFLHGTLSHQSQSNRLENLGDKKRNDPAYIAWIGLIQNTGYPRY